tara:strand:- start:3055 stop:3273 length:219 start_codon:yes stop_codon:yes gene_type:complete
MDQQILTDSAIAAITTATVHTGVIANQVQPNNNTIITLLISIVSGIIAPILKSFLEKQHTKYITRKNKKNVS